MNYFGGEIIKIKGHLKNLTNKEKSIIEAQITKIKNKIKYETPDAKYEVIFEKEDIYIIRENEEIKSIMQFRLNQRTVCDYLIKKDDISLQIELQTYEILKEKKEILIRYQVENADIYEYLIEFEE